MNGKSKGDFRTTEEGNSGKKWVLLMFMSLIYQTKCLTYKMTYQMKLCLQEVYTS